MAFQRAIGLRCLLVVFFAGCATVTLEAQSEPPTAHPYATMDRGSVSYQGPGRGSSSDIGSDTLNIGIVLPLQGPAAAQGNLLLQAAQLAVDEENGDGSLSKGKRLAIVARDESKQWGQASNAIVQLITQDQSIAVITSLDGKIAHQAEQIANKIGEPVLTLSSDPTITQINIPWIFRVVPSDADQAPAIAADIIRPSTSRKVLLIAEVDHDGRIGGDEFMKEASSLNGLLAERLDVNATNFSAPDFARELGDRKPDAIVVWSGPELSMLLLPLLQSADPAISIYFCQKAAAFLPQTIDSDLSSRIIVPRTRFKKGSKQFSTQYRQASGAEPVMAAEQMYEAVLAIIRGVRQVGPNRARLRDYLASGASTYPPAGSITFDPAGNSRQEVTLIRLGRSSMSENYPCNPSSTDPGSALAP